MLIVIFLSLGCVAYDDWKNPANIGNSKEILEIRAKIKDLNNKVNRIGFDLVEENNKVNTKFDSITEDLRKVNLSSVRIKGHIEKLEDNNLLTNQKIKEIKKNNVKMVIEKGIKHKKQS